MHEILTEYLLMRLPDIIGPNSHLVAQSGTFPIKGNDIEQKDIDSMQQKDKEITAQALETEFGVSDRRKHEDIKSSRRVSRAIHPHVVLSLTDP
jgi:hypothetical protein